jgi:serine/threonine protein kinase
MPLSPQRWKRVTQSAFPWEAEALEYLRTALPDCDPYAGWTNFSFIADDGTVNEVDALITTPRGLFLVEIKSDDGELRGDRGTWTYHKPNGRTKVVDNPLLTADRKCKKLKSLLEHQPACRSERLSFIEPLVFLSNPELKNLLSESDRIRICQRDRENAPGIIAALKFRNAPGLKHDVPLLNRPILRSLAKGLDEAGIRPSQRHRRVADYELKELLGEGPDHAFQDWRGEHVSLKNDARRIRIYVISRQPQVDARQVHKMAESEYDILSSLRNEHILEAQAFTEHELGPAVLFRHEPGEIRLDHYLKQNGATLPLHLRIDFVRQIADALRYAHGRRVIHRALGPQSILVTGAETPQPQLKIFNWQAGRFVGTTSHGTSVTVHVEDWLEDANYVYIAPEAIHNRNLREEVCDIFSLGALAFHIFSNQPPAPNLNELRTILSQHQGLPLPAVLDGAGPKLAQLIRDATHPDTLLRTESAATFLKQLDEVEEELTAPEDSAVPDPLKASIDDRLPGGLIVKGKLGTGGSAAALLVEYKGEPAVLKIALKPEYNARLRDELQLLLKLRHPFIVAPKSPDILTFNGLDAFLVELAGERTKAGVAGAIEGRSIPMTLADRLREDGRLSGEFLERFGDDLLNVLEYLEHEGIPHRDLKPDNIGVRTYSKQLHLKLFDFSLSSLPFDNIRAGTPDYMEPFLATRHRWDTAAERFSAALVLYEMAAGKLPRWGNGQSAPQVIPDEVTVASNVFDSQVREPLTRFFSRALRRNPAERFDTASEMRLAWHTAFSEARFTDSQLPDPGARTQAIAAATPETPILSLQLSTRAQNILERENINTVADLVATSPARFRHLRGVGDKTRKEIIELIADLRARFPESIIPALPAPPTGDEEAPLVRSVDEIASQLLPSDASKFRGDRETLAAVLDLTDPNATTAPAWPSQSQVAEARHVTRARIGQIVTAARQRWRRNPSLTEIRALIADRLTASGLLETGEFATTLLAARGSTAEGPLRLRLASAVARAAVEAERAIERPQFGESRCLNAVLILPADSAAIVDWARRIGESARDLAATHPLPSPTRALQTLRAIPTPPDFAPPDDARLLRLAATLAGAALSPRLEIYPRNLPPRDALELSQSALAPVDSISIPELRERVRERYPESAPLPDYPAIGDILRQAGYDWTWDPAASLYRAPRPTSTDISTTFGPRSATRLTPRLYEVPPAEREDFDTARDTEHKLTLAVRSRGFLVLTASLSHYYEGVDELVRRFRLDVIDLDHAILDSMRALADARNHKWDRVLTADAEPAGSFQRTKLAGLVADAISTVEAAIRARTVPVLLVNPGLLARYNQLSLIDRFRDDPGAGVWLLVAGQDTHRPMIDSEAVPFTSPNHWARVNLYWIQNLHRAGAPA